MKNSPLEVEQFRQRVLQLDDRPEWRSATGREGTGKEAELAETVE
jgi:hypothetical protein